ncbi:glyoxalase superfamily protein [Flavilitoribacter nigricans]|uniref:Bleomycin resistance protein n=1 Tax=Flavilitoribacter nigricans (strain ATCC 23147 / DSM 23189 / NBRC 102662 / NCIMB 1420 / SS-2) TaxID=1122177 RepID=A0A2D0N2Y4_FLAN2|nr:glyoxalase superfamily protein [Flavilitoribacter nigricans]PHN02499.1 glyoxalase/bleomycin resistance/extradiol dioxygenase family protein [Flavilitoribacter nigricans DSM 23189 = NBRC 102662]
MNFKAPIPILRIFDEAKAREFYADYLGFSIDWEHRFEPGMPLYMQVSRAGCVLHLSEHHGDGTPGTRLRIECDDVVAYRRELQTRNYKYLNPGIGKQPWAEQEMCLTDPFGNMLILYKPA